MSTSWNPQAFAARLKETIGKESVSAFVRKCEFAESMLRKYLLGVSVPGTDKLVRMSEISGVSIRWLAKGEGSRTDTVGCDQLLPSQLAIVLEFERYTRQRANVGIRQAIRAFVDDYNAGLLDIGEIGDIRHISEDELILWRDLAWERRVEKANIDQAGLLAAIGIADELVETLGRPIDPQQKARLIVAIYRLNATTESGLDRSMLINLLTSIS